MQVCNVSLKLLTFVNDKECILSVTLSGTLSLLPKCLVTCFIKMVPPQLGFPSEQDFGWTVSQRQQTGEEI